MCRKLVLCALVLGLGGLATTSARAQSGNAAMDAARNAPIPTSGRAGAEAQNEAAPEPTERGTDTQGLPQAVGHDDGPAQVDSEESISAGAGDNFTGVHTPAEKVAPTADGHPVGTYAGVEPGGAQAPAVPVVAGKTPLAITWPGFQMRPDGTSRVFVQSTSALEAQTAQADGKFTMKFLGAKVAGATNRFPLETRFFNTPVTKVSLAVARDGVTLVLELRAPVTPRISSERGASGFYFTYLDLPAGKFVDAPKAAPVKSLAGGEGADESLVPPQPEHLTTLDGDEDVQKKGSSKAKIKVSAGASTDSSMDNELPPGIKASNKTQPTGASGGIKLGK